MKTTQLITIALLLLSLNIHSQVNSNRISVEMNAGMNQFTMHNFNQYFIRTYLGTNYSLKDIPNSINRGQKYQVAINYRPTGLFDVGLYGCYQFQTSKTKPIYVEQQDEYGNPIIQHEGKRFIRTEAFSFGVSSTFYLSHLLKFQYRKDSSNRVHFGIELNGGIGLARMINSRNFSTPSPNSPGSFTIKYNCQGFQGMLGMRYEYEFVQKPIFSSIGVKAGYQFFRTTTLKNFSGIPLIKQPTTETNEVEQEIYLDFSGLYFGVYLRIGN